MLFCLAQARPTGAQGASQEDEGGVEEDGDMANLLDFFIGGN